MKYALSFLAACALALGIAACTNGDIQGSVQSAEPSGQSEPAAATAEPELITLEDAKAIALEDAGVADGDASFFKTKQERGHGRQVYELEFRTGTDEFDYEIDAVTGEVLGFEREALPTAVPVQPTREPAGNPGSEPTPHSGLTIDEAKQLVLDWVPGAGLSDIREFETDWEDGRLVYEGEIVYDGIEYEFEIDGSTGAQLSWETEPARH